MVSRKTRDEVEKMFLDFVKGKISPKEFIEWADEIYCKLDSESKAKIYDAKVCGIIKFHLPSDTEKWKEINWRN